MVFRSTLQRRHLPGRRTRDREDRFDRSASPLLDLSIRDDHGNEVPAGTEVELCLRGPKGTQGYWRDSAKTAPSFFGDWSRTGDVGYLDDEGFLFLTDHKKDMIISGGENIASGQAAAALERLYRYYISMDALRNRGTEGQGSIVRLNAGVIESAVVQKIRQLLRAPEIAAKACAALKAARSGFTENDVAGALATFDSFWDNLFPAEQDRTARLLIERVVISKDGMSLDLRTSGLSSLVSDMLQLPKLDKAA